MKAFRPKLHDMVMDNIAEAGSKRELTTPWEDRTSCNCS